MSENVYVEPNQPEDVVRAIADALADGSQGGPDPWWRAGQLEATGEGAGADE